MLSRSKFLIFLIVIAIFLMLLLFYINRREKFTTEIDLSDKELKFYSTINTNMNDAINKMTDTNIMYSEVPPKFMDYVDLIT